MYFPIAEIEVHPLIPPIVAFVIAFFTSMGGLSGAFLLLPFQVSVLGFNSPAVSATNHLYNLTAVPGGVYRYVKEGRMLWPLAWIIIIGSLPGVLIGTIIRIQYFPDPRNFKMFVGLVLLYIVFRLLKDIVNKFGKPSSEEKFPKPKTESEKNNGASFSPTVIVRKFNLLHISYDFHGENFTINTIGISALSLMVGIIGGIYGIGGGAIIAPFLISFLGLPVYTIAGATLMGTFVTSAAGVLFYQILAPFYPDVAIAPDWLLGVLFGIGGFAGLYFGAKFQKFVPSKIIKWILVLCMLFIASKYIISFFIE
jgi:uncharacterized membrane protein YfcA